MKIAKLFLVSFFSIMLFGCSTISQYSHYAYTQSVNLKVDSMNVMMEAVENYNIHENEVKELILKVEKSYEYEKGRPKNEITIKMWDKLKSPDKDLLGGFLKLWKQKGTLNQSFVEEKSKQIGKAFDEIIGLESGKIKKSDVSE